VSGHAKMPPASHQVSATSLKLLIQQIHPHVRLLPFNHPELLSLSSGGLRLVIRRLAAAVANDGGFVIAHVTDGPTAMKNSLNSRYGSHSVSDLGRPTLCGLTPCSSSPWRLLAPHTSGPRDVPRCGALSLLQKTPHYRGVDEIAARLNTKLWTSVTVGGRILPPSRSVLFSNPF
jgi:hypothetical protein